MNYKITTYRKLDSTSGKMRGGGQKPYMSDPLVGLNSDLDKAKRYGFSSSPGVLPEEESRIQLPKPIFKILMKEYV
jgi:hypothetical protein